MMDFIPIRFIAGVVSNKMVGSFARIIIFSKVRVHILPLVGPGVGFRQCKKPKKSNPRAQKSSKNQYKTVTKRTFNKPKNESTT